MKLLLSYSNLHLFSWNFQNNFQSKFENPFYNAGIMKERANSPQHLKDKLPFYSANFIFLTCFSNCKFETTERAVISPHAPFTVTFLIPMQQLSASDEGARKLIVKNKTDCLLINYQFKELFQLAYSLITTGADAREAAEVRRHGAKGLDYPWKRGPVPT